jgi:hypothetical protein
MIGDFRISSPLEEIRAGDVFGDTGSTIVQPEEILLNRQPLGNAEVSGEISSDVQHSFMFHYRFQD